MQQDNTACQNQQHNHNTNVLQFNGKHKTMSYKRDNYMFPIKTLCTGLSDHYLFEIMYNLEAA